MAGKNRERRGQEQGDDGARLRAALAALGASAGAMDTVDSRIHDAFVRAWRSTGQPPMLRDISIELGIPRGTLDGAIARMMAAGSIIRGPRRGQYVPVL